MLRTDELFATKSRHAGFNSSRAHTDDEQSQKRKFSVFLKKKKRLNTYSIILIDDSACLRVLEADILQILDTYFCGSVFGMEATLSMILPQA